MKAKGEVAALAETINNVTGTLATFADQVTSVAREVGVEGRLGGQANLCRKNGVRRLAVIALLTIALHLVAMGLYLRNSLSGEIDFHILSAERFGVPRVLAVSEGGVIGCPFYVMERVQGHVITTAVPPELDSIEDRRRMGEELVDALVEVHAIDWQAAGLEGFGKPTGYLERQLKRFLGLWDHNKTREIPAVETVADWLRANFPEAGPSTVVHGDYRLGNTMFAPEAPARLNAIFDWEMSTIGDPLADLGYMCTIWIDRGDPSLGMFELNGITREEGFPLRAELVARYEERSGRSMTDIRWYQTLALWKSIVFMEGNYKRAVSGATDDPYLKGFGEGVVQLAERAEAVTRGA